MGRTKTQVYTVGAQGGFMGLLQNHCDYPVAQFCIEATNNKSLARTVENNPNVISQCGKLAKKIYLLRRKRDEIFPKSIFSDPAWDILLDLYIAEIDNKKVSITSACIASGVAPTTALRWIRVLLEKDLISRHDDPHDNRRSFVRITANAANRITELLAPNVP